MLWYNYLYENTMFTNKHDAALLGKENVSFMQDERVALEAQLPNRAEKVSWYLGDKHFAFFLVYSGEYKILVMF